MSNIEQTVAFGRIVEDYLNKKKVLTSVAQRKSYFIFECSNIVRFRAYTNLRYNFNITSFGEVPGYEIIRVPRSENNNNYLDSAIEVILDRYPENYPECRTLRDYLDYIVSQASVGNHHNSPNTQKLTHQEPHIADIANWRINKTRTIRLLEHFFDDHVANNPESFHPFVHSNNDAYTEQTKDRLDMASNYFEKNLSPILHEDSSILISNQIKVARNKIADNKHVDNNTVMDDIKFALKEFMFIELKETSRIGVITHPIGDFWEIIHGNPPLTYDASWGLCPTLYNIRKMDRNKVVADVEYVLENCNGRNATAISIGVNSNVNTFTVYISSNGVFNFEGFINSITKQRYRDMEYFKVRIDFPNPVFYWDSTETDPHDWPSNNFVGYTIKMIFPV
jgi:hypothetical protein